jgi:hypothetical protein
MCGLTSDLLLRMGLQPLPAKRSEATPVVLTMNRQSHPHRSPAWELRGVSVQYRVDIHEVLAGGPRGKTPAVKDSMRTI